MLSGPWRTARKSKNCGRTGGRRKKFPKPRAGGRDGPRLPDQRLRYSAELAQRRVQQSLEKRGKRAGQPTDSGQAAEAAGR